MGRRIRQRQGRQVSFDERSAPHVPPRGVEMFSGEVDAGDRQASAREEVVVRQADAAPEIDHARAAREPVGELCEEVTLDRAAQLTVAAKRVGVVYYFITCAHYAAQIRHRFLHGRRRLAGQCAVSFLP